MTAPLIVILAGGEGRRIGGDKPLRTLGGERLIDRAIHSAREWSDDVRLSLREIEQVPAITLPILLDDQNSVGPISGLLSAFRAAHHAGRAEILTIPCDVPFLPDDLCKRLQTEIGDQRAAVASSQSCLHPTCALWKAEALEQLVSYTVAGRRSLIGFAKEIGFTKVEWSGDHFYNVNSGADLKAAERRLSSEV